MTSGGTGLEGALVCIMSAGGDVYGHGETDATGEIEFNISPSEEDSLHVTGVAPNHIPYEGTPLIEADNPGVSGDLRAGTGPWFRVVSNPVREVSRFRFGVEAQTPVVIRVFDVSGRPIRDVTSLNCVPGVHDIKWDALDRSGEPVVPGIYFGRFSGSGLTVTGRLVLLK